MQPRIEEAYQDDLAQIHHEGFSKLAVAAGHEFTEALRCKGHSNALVVDLGCGSGPLSEVASGAGYGVLGVDISGPLLDLARKRVPTGSFVQESLFDFEIPPCVGVACVGECLNYLFDSSNSDGAMAALFKRISEALPRDGIFLFDVLTAAHPASGYRNWTESDDWAVLVDVSVDEADRLLTRDIVTYRRVGDVYRRAREVHRVRLLEPERIAEHLRAAGFRFRNLASYGDIRLRKGHRAFLATRK